MTAGPVGSLFCYYVTLEPMDNGDLGRLTFQKAVCEVAATEYVSVLSVIVKIMM